MQAKSFGLITSLSSRRHSIRNAITAPIETIVLAVAIGGIAAIKSKNRQTRVLRPEGPRSGCCSIGEVTPAGHFQRETSILTL